MKRRKNEFASHLVENALRELISFQDEFDPENAEDVQVRTGALINAFKKAGLIDNANVYSIRLRDTLAGFKLRIAKRDELAVIAEKFEDLTSSYGGTPTDEDMTKAQEILEELVCALRPPLEKLLEGLVRP